MPRREQDTAHGRPAGATGRADAKLAPMTAERLWEGTATNGIAAAVSAAMLVVAVFTALASEPLAALIPVGGLAVALPYTRVHVAVDRDHLTVRLGPWGWPLRRHPLDEIDWIEHATVTRGDVRIGIGRKGSARSLSGVGILLRPGDAIRFQGARGVRHTVTVDGALGAVAVVERLLGER